jgi:hypothetical protein
MRCGLGMEGSGYSLWLPFRESRSLLKEEL